MLWGLLDREMNAVPEKVVLPSPDALALLRAAYNKSTLWPETETICTLSRGTLM